MIINFCVLLIILIFVIILNSILGVLLPYYFHVENIAIYQIILLTLLGILAAFLCLSFINKELSGLHKVIHKNIKENKVCIKPKSKDRCYFKNIPYFLNNFGTIIKSYNHLIENQNLLLEKHYSMNNKLKKNNQVRDVMLEVSNSIVSINNTEKLFELILEKLINIIDDGDMGSFIILGEDNFLEYKAVVGFDINKLKNIRLRLDETFLSKKNGENITKPCIIKDVRRFNSYNLNSETYEALDNIKALDIKTTLSTPIIINGNLYGMINIDSLKTDAFSNEDLLVAEYFSNQISIALKNHQLIEKIMYLSKYDSMTGIYNRYYFEELSGKFYRKARRYNENFCLVMFDLDSLKYINDTFGHVIGDMAISEFAKIIKKNIRESDLFARYGGDEFIAMLFKSCAIDIKNKLSNIISYFNTNPILVDGKKVFITFSYGIACYPEDSKDINSVIKLADKRMYEYKNRSKTRL
ncbi:MAG: sensor domain-containing diguanylate cyclase [Clostridia bacterium]|nr:sensor domain-containing diguanylate cyclase [Clostridia bacterium]